MMRLILRLSISISIPIFVLLLAMALSTTSARNGPVKLENSETIISDNSGASVSPAVAYNSNQGEYLVIWDSQQPQGHEIRGQRITVDGTLIGQYFTVTAPISFSFILPDTPAVTYNSNNKEFLVVWNDEVSHLHGQRVLSDGLLSGMPFTISTSLSSSPHRPTLVYSAEHDQFLLAWRGCTASCYFYAQILNGLGGQSSDGVTATAGTYFQGFAAVAYMQPRDEYWMAWSEQSRIVVQRILTTGLLINDPFTVTEGTSEMLDPSISNLSGEDELLIMWADSRDSQFQRSPLGGGFHSIYGQRVLSDGLTSGSAFRISHDLTSVEPKVIYLPQSAQFIVAWTTIDFVNHQTDIHAHWISKTGEPIGTDYTIVETLDDQQNPALTGAGTALIAWEDSRGVPDIRGRLLQTPTWIYFPVVLRNAP